MTFNEINSLELLGKKIYLKKRNGEFVKIYLSGVIKHGDDFYFITKTTAVNSSNESVIRQVKVDFIVNGLTTGKYVKVLPENARVVDGKRLTKTDNSYYKDGYDDAPRYGGSYSYGGCGGGWTNYRGGC